MRSGRFGNGDPSRIPDKFGRTESLLTTVDYVVFRGIFCDSASHSDRLIGNSLEKFSEQPAFFAHQTNQLPGESAMRRIYAKSVLFGLMCLVIASSTSPAWARYGSSAFRRYIQQQQKMQQQVMQMEQKAMMEAMQREAAFEQKRRENIQKASKARHDKEEQHRQEMIAKRKAEQAAKESSDGKK
jgi:hypothetical protein